METFWMDTLSSLKPVLSNRVIKACEEEEAFRYAYAVFVCLFSIAISDWNNKGFDKKYRKTVENRVASISKYISTLYPYLKTMFQNS